MAPPALITRTAQLGPMSPEMKPQEVETFVEHLGFPPTCYAVALDCLAVFVLLAVQSLFRRTAQPPQADGLARAGPAMAAGRESHAGYSPIPGNQAPCKPSPPALN